MASRFHLSLPQQPTFYHHKNQQQGTRRAPLTPSSVTPPSLNAYTSPASRRDSYGSGGSHRASALLAKVASHPSSPRRTPAASPMASPVGEEPQHSARTPTHDEWKTMSNQDAARHCWSHRPQQDGYISFPDYEKYWSGYENIQRERSRERSSAKT